jgi:hypothetical protein
VWRRIALPSALAYASVPTTRRPCHWSSPCHPRVVVVVAVADPPHVAVALAVRYPCRSHHRGAAPSSCLSRDATWRIAICLPLLRPAMERTACDPASWDPSSFYPLLAGFCPSLLGARRAEYLQTQTRPCHHTSRARLEMRLRLHPRYHGIPSLKVPRSASAPPVPFSSPPSSSLVDTERGDGARSARPHSPSRFLSTRHRFPSLRTLAASHHHTSLRVIGKPTALFAYRSSSSSSPVPRCKRRRASLRGCDVRSSSPLRAPRSAPSRGPRPWLTIFSAIVFAGGDGARGWSLRVRRGVSIRSSSPLCPPRFA